MTILSRSASRARRRRPFRPSFGSERPKLESRVSPTPVMIFVFDSPYGYFSGSTQTVLTPRGSSDPSGTMPTIINMNSTSNSTGFSILSQLPWTVIQGTQPMPGSGGPVPGVDYVRGQASGRVTANLAGPVRGSSSGTQSINLVVTHQHHEEADFITQAFYPLPLENKVITNFSTSPSLGFNLVNNAGGAPFGTANYSFSLRLDAPTGGFTNHATMSLVTDQFRAYLGPNPVTSGGLLIQGLGPGGWTTLYSNPAFISGTQTATFSAPVGSHMTVAASSMLADVYPDYVGADVSNNGFLSYSLLVTMS